MLFFGGLKAILREATALKSVSIKFHFCACSTYGIAFLAFFAAQKLQIVFFLSFFLSLLLSTCIICACFPDVCFREATVTLNGLITVTRKVYGTNLRLKWRSGTPATANGQTNFKIFGGALYQSEPMTLFTRKTILNWESPYWNPLLWRWAVRATNSRRFEVRCSKPC